MNGKRPESPASNRMFHTIVLMGSGLALSCGGVAKIESGNEAGGASGTPSTPSSGDGGSISAAGVGVSSGGTGIIIGGLGGAAGGTPIGAAGNTAFGGAGGFAGSPTLNGCPYTQLDCSNSTSSGQCSYNYDYTVSIGTDCFCNSNRPESASDCRPGFVFTCLQGETGTDNTPTAFECTCTPAAADGANCDLCQTSFGTRSYSCVETPTPNSVLCGCTIVVLK